jgi:hypothetical protein
MDELKSDHPPSSESIKLAFQQKLNHIEQSLAQEQIRVYEESQRLLRQDIIIKRYWLSSDLEERALLLKEAAEIHTKYLSPN